MIKKISILVCLVLLISTVLIGCSDEPMTVSDSSVESLSESTATPDTSFLEDTPRVFELSEVFYDFEPEGPFDRTGMALPDGDIFWGPNLSQMEEYPGDTVVAVRIKKNGLTEEEYATVEYKGKTALEYDIEYSEVFDKWQNTPEDSPEYEAIHEECKRLHAEFLTAAWYITDIVHSQKYLDSFLDFGFTLVYDSKEDPEHEFWNDSRGSFIVLGTLDMFREFDEAIEGTEQSHYAIILYGQSFLDLLEYKQP